MPLHRSTVGPVSLQYGFSLMLNSEKGRWGNIQRYGQYAKVVPRHPFGLDVTLPVAGDYGKIMLVAYSGVTETSVKGMIAHLMYALGNGHSRDGRDVSRLREIQLGDDNGHFIYFEVWTSLDKYICGGCTDSSGEGGSGTQKMRSIFALLSHVYEVPHEVVEISREAAKKAAAELADEFDLCF